MNRTRHTLRFLPALGLVVLALGCHPPHHAHEAQGELPVSHPVRRSTSITHEYVGQVRAIRHIEVRALERGYLEGVFVDEGQRVKKGQRMFQLMPRVYQAEVRKAAAEAAKSRIELENTRLLAEQKVVSPNELALARANLERANAELELAQVHRSLTGIRAPFDGIMGRFQARHGSLLDEGDLLTTLSDNSTMWVYFNVSEAEYLELSAGGRTGPRKVQLRLAHGKTYDIPGVVETDAADFDNETGTIAFRAAFPNPTGLLRHGETGTVLVEEQVDDALLVPQRATFEVLDRKFVYVVDGAGVVHARPITVVAEQPQLYLVGDGLSTDDRILLDGLRKVRDGATIATRTVPDADALAHLEVPAE